MKAELLSIDWNFVLSQGDAIVKVPLFSSVLQVPLKFILFEVDNIVSCFLVDLMSYSQSISLVDFFLKKFIQESPSV